MGRQKVSPYSALKIGCCKAGSTLCSGHKHTVTFPGPWSLPQVQYVCAGSQDGAGRRPLQLRLYTTVLQQRLLALGPTALGAVGVALCPVAVLLVGAGPHAWSRVFGDEQGHKEWQQHWACSKQERRSRDDSTLQKGSNWFRSSSQIFFCKETFISPSMVLFLLTLHWPKVVSYFNSPAVVCPHESLRSTEPLQQFTVICLSVCLSVRAQHSIGGVCGKSKLVSVCEHREYKSVSIIKYHEHSPRSYFYLCIM